MKTTRFKFNTNILGIAKALYVEVPILPEGVRTNKFCPSELLIGGCNPLGSLIEPINGEGREEFISDCRKQVLAMEAAGMQRTLLDVHIAGLMAAVMDHLARCGRLIFGDLLIYMDCFSLLLEADAFDKMEIKKMYPRILRSIIELYPNYVFNTFDLSPFKGSQFEFILKNICQE